MKTRKDCKKQKFRRFKKAIENEIIRKMIWDKTREIKQLGKKIQNLKEKLEESLNIFTSEGVIEEIKVWELKFKIKIENEIK